MSSPKLWIKFLRTFAIFAVIFGWIYSSYPQIWQNPKIPPEISKTEAAYGNGYDYRRSITIDQNYVTGNSDHLSFPVLVSLSTSTLRTTGYGGRVTNSSGYDIIFTSDEAGSTKLDHEIERYNEQTGEVTMWVEVPTLDFDNNTIIYMFYGNSSIISSQEAITGTWDSNYKAILHMAETSGQHLDSTLNNNDSTNVTVTTQGSAGGKFSGADDFDGTDDSVTIGDSTTLDIANTGTIEAWVKTDNVNTWESSPSAWTSIATSTMTGAGAGEWSGVDNVIVGETAYFGAMLCSDTTETFQTATWPIAGGTFSTWTSRTATGTSASTGGCQIAVDSDGQFLWFVTLSGNAAGTGYVAYATSTLDFSSISAWKSMGTVTSAGAAEQSGIDVVITGGRAYVAALLADGAAEAFWTGSVALNGSGWTGWTNQADPVGSGAGEGCSIGIETDGTKLYYAALCFSGAVEDYETARSNLDGTGFVGWTTGNNPAGVGASNFSYNDIALVGGQMQHAAFMHVAAVTDYNTASTTVEGGTLTWIVKKASSASVDPDGAGATGVNTTDTSVESDGKNLHYSAFTHNAANASFFIASSTLPAHPFVSKLNAYEMIQTGSGFVFDWAGKPTTFGTTTAASAFYHVAVTQDGSIMNYYINGALYASTTVSTDFESNANALLLGKGFRSNGSGIFFDGIIDEVRVSASARSADWILTQYNNQNATSTFYTLGGEQTSNTPPSLTVSAPPLEGATVTVGDSYNISYTLSDAEQAVTAKFFYDADGSGLDGAVISGCETKGEGETICAWNTAGVTPDTYYVYATTTDGIAAEVNDYSPGELTVNAAASLTLIVDTDNFPSLTPGTPMFATSTVSVDTNNSNGWYVTLERQDADTTLDRDADTTVDITDQTAWTAPAATNTHTEASSVKISSFDNSQRVLAFRVMTASSTNGSMFFSSSWWGSADSYVDNANTLWAGVPAPSSNQKIGISSVNSGGSPALNTVLYYLDVPNTQKTGAYSGSVIYTAVKN